MNATKTIVLYPEFQIVSYKVLSTVVVIFGKCERMVYFIYIYTYIFEAV